MDATTFTEKAPAPKEARRKATICIDVTYDPEVTDPDKLASLYAHLVETGTLEEFNESDEPECFQQYGEGAIVGWRAVGSPVVVKTSDIKKLVDYDPDPDPSYAERMAEDGAPAELEAINSGEFIAYYCKAVVTIDIPCDGADDPDVPRNLILHRVESPGLWGIYAASDDDPYFDEVFAEERNTLVWMLRKMGIRVEDDQKKG
jgi:hypothetical protein